MFFLTSYVLRISLLPIILRVPDLPDVADKVRTWIEGSLAWLPTRGCDFFAFRLADKLKGLDLADRLFNVPADRRGEDFHALYYSVGIDNETAADIHARFFIINPIDLTEVSACVRDHRERYSAFDHFGEFVVVPDLVYKLAVYAAGINIHSKFLKYGVFVGDRRHFSSSDEGEITWIETEDYPFPK